MDLRSEAFLKTPLPGSPRIVPATDGYPLAVTRFSPRRGLRARVVLSSATGVPQRYYQRFARYLADRGLEVLTYDYRGVGGSRPPKLRGFEARMLDWGRKDFAGVLDFALAAGPEPVLVVGHSVGGQLVGLAPNAHRVRGIVTVGSQSGWVRHWSGMGQLKMALYMYALVPGVARAVGYLPGGLGLGEALPEGVARQWAAWCRRPEYLFGSREPRRPGYARIVAPMLAVSVDDDDYAPRAAVDWLAAQYTNATVERRHLRPADLGRRSVGHFGPFRLACADPFWRDLRTWLLERVPA